MDGYKSMDEYEGSLEDDDDMPQGDDDILARWKERGTNGALGGVKSDFTMTLDQPLSEAPRTGRSSQRRRQSKIRQNKPFRSASPSSRSDSGSESGRSSRGSHRSSVRSTGSGAVDSRRASTKTGLSRSELKELRALNKAQEEKERLEQELKEKELKENPPTKVEDDKTAARLLDSSFLKFVGRESEVDELRTASQSLFDENAPSQVILVTGGSGTGKTRLVNEVLKEFKGKAFCASGKFENHDNDVSRPYLGFILAFEQLFQQIQEHPDKEEYASAIRVALGAEACRVSGIIPSLVDLIGEDFLDADDQIDPDTFRDKSSLKQIFRLLRELLRQICSPTLPVMLFLDDLQWGGKESFALFQNLADDSRLTNLLLVGTYRDEDSQPLSLMMEEIGEVKSSFIRLSPLDPESVNAMVSELIGMDMPSTKKFSTVVLQKTGGNALFIIQFMYRMQELGYLQYSPKIQRWGWDLPQILRETNANDEVSDMVVQRMRHLPLTAQTVLTRAACLGNSFQISILEQTLTWDHSVNMDEGLKKDEADLESSPIYLVYMRALEVVSGESKLTVDVVTILKALIKLGFMEHIDDANVRFAHDMIHHAAQSQPTKVRAEIHWRAGQLLRCILDETDGDKGDQLFFSTVDHLNQGCTCIQEDDDRLELAALNLKASYKVRESSAFFQASGYAKQGLMLLAAIPHKWEFYQSLTAKLLLVMAEMAMCCGKTKDCMAATQEIIRNSRTLDEKVPAYRLRIKNLAQAGKYHNAVDEGIEVLNLLGEMFPKEPNVVAYAYQLAKSKKEVYGRTDESIGDLAVMKDDALKMKMKIMLEVASHAFRGNDRTQRFVSLLYFRMFQITLTSGLCKESVTAFAGYGILVADGNGDHTEGRRFGQIAMELQSGLGHRNLARSSNMNYGYLYHLKNHLSDTLGPLMDGFKAGMVCDEAADAADTLFLYSSHYLNCGLPLEPLAGEMKQFLGLMVDFENERTWQMTVPYAQLVENLMGKNTQPSVLSGEMMHLKQLMDKVKKSDHMNALRCIYAARLETAYWFASYDMALRMAQHLKDLKLGVGQSLAIHYRREVFFTALTYLAVAKTTKNNRSYLWSARDCISKIKAWATRGSVDCDDLLLILNAELDAVTARKTSQEITDGYDKAISNAIRIGSLQNLALCSELGGSYVMSIGDYGTAQHLLEEAHKGYKKWNAFQKANHLEVLYPQLFTKLTIR